VQRVGKHRTHRPEQPFGNAGGHEAQHVIANGIRLGVLGKVFAGRHVVLVLRHLRNELDGTLPELVGNAFAVVLLARQRVAQDEPLDFGPDSEPIAYEIP
jgi:hypothetical protein